MFGLRNTSVSMNSIVQNTNGKKVLLISPWSSYRPVFFAQLSSLIRQGLIYYITPAHIETFHELIHDISHQIRTKNPSFGKNLNKIQDTGSAVDLGEALAKDLNALATSPIALFLDEIKPALFDNQAQAVSSLLDNLSDHVKLVFSSQLSSYEPWKSWLAKKSAVLLNVERRRHELNFTQDTTAKPHLEVFGFGSGTALIDGLEVTQWEGMLPRTLFFYLIDHPVASRDDIFGDFWPQPRITVKDATDIFHVTKHKVSEVLNKRLGTPNVIELTAYKQGVYIPSNRLVRYYDVAMFTDLLQHAEMNEADREMLLLRAIDLYKGPFLSALEAQWVVQRRHELNIMYSDALIELGRISNQRGDHHNALARFEEALVYRPEREDVHRSIIHILAQIGEPAKAKEHIAMLKATIYTPLGMSDSPEVQQVLDDHGLAVF